MQPHGYTVVVMNNAIAEVVARYSSSDLRHVRRTLEAELLEHCASGAPSTQAHVGKLEILSAVGAELDHRGALFPPPAWVETNTVSEYDATARLSFAIRVY